MANQLNSRVNTNTPQPSATNANTPTPGSSGGSLIHHWKLDDTANDFAGTNHGSIQGNTAVNQTGKMNGAFAFDGYEDRVIVTPITLNGDWSIAYWYYQNAADKIIMGQNGTDQNRLYHYTTTLYHIKFNDGSHDFFNFTQSLNSWHHVVVTRQGSTVTVYKDGAYSDSKTISNANFVLDSIGNGYLNNGYDWNGKIDDVRIYDGALSGSQVNGLFNEASNPTPTHTYSPTNTHTPTPVPPTPTPTYTFTDGPSPTPSSTHTFLPTWTPAPEANINTIAGNGTAGSAANESEPLSSPLNSPLALDVSPDGSIFIADTDNNRISFINTSILFGDNRLYHYAGNGSSGNSGDNGDALSATLTAPRGVAVSHKGHVYISSGNVIRDVDISTGLITTVVSTSAGLNSPAGLCVDFDGNLYIADPLNHRIMKYEYETQTLSVFAGTGTAGYNGEGLSATQSKLNEPTDVECDYNGNVYIADSQNHRVRVVTANLEMYTVTGNGTASSTGDNGKAEDATLDTPLSVAMDGSGILYVAENYRIRRVVNELIDTVAGNGSADFSGDGGAASSAQFGVVRSIAADFEGNLYLADAGNHRIRRIQGFGFGDDVTTNINTAWFFPDPNFRAKVETYMGVSSGGQFTVADTTAKTEELDISNSNVSDLSGLEFFSNLTGLDVSNNQIWTLNLKQNRYLTEVQAHNNYLTTVDVSNNPALDILNLSHNRLSDISSILDNHWMGYGDVVDVRYNFLDLGSDPAIPALHDKFAAGVETYPQKVNPVPSGTPCAGGDWYYDCNNMIEPAYVNQPLEYEKYGQIFGNSQVTVEPYITGENEGSISMRVEFDGFDNSGESGAINTSLTNVIWRDIWLTSGCLGSKNANAQASINNLDTYGESAFGDAGESLAQIQGIFYTAPDGESLSFSYHAGAKIEDLNTEYQAASRNSFEPIWVEDSNVNGEAGGFLPAKLLEAPWNAAQTSYSELYFSVEKANVSVSGNGDYLGYAELSAEITRDKGTCPVTPTPAPPTDTPVGTPTNTYTPTPLATLPTLLNVTPRIYEAANQINEAPAIPSDKRSSDLTKVDWLYLGSERKYGDEINIYPAPFGSVVSIVDGDNYKFSFELNPPPTPFNNYILWHLESNGLSSKTGIYSPNTIDNIIESQFISPRTNQFELWLDKNQNGQIDPPPNDEIIKIFKIVGISNREYRESNKTISYIKYLSTPILRLGPWLLNYFQYYNNYNILSSMSPTSTSINYHDIDARTESSLSYNTGEDFIQNGINEGHTIIDELFFDKNHQASKLIVHSNEIVNLLKPIFSHTNIEDFVQSHFEQSSNPLVIQNPGVLINNSSVIQIDGTFLDIQGSPKAFIFDQSITSANAIIDREQTDLFVAIKNCFLTESLKLKSFTVKKIDNVETGVIISVSNYEISGKFEDLYDFDINTAWPAPPASKLQIAFRQDKERNNGKIFYNVFEIDTISNDRIFHIYENQE